MVRRSATLVKLNLEIFYIVSSQATMSLQYNYICLNRLRLSKISAIKLNVVADRVYMNEPVITKAQTNIDFSIRIFF